jgi:hypothetical protein
MNDGYADVISRSVSESRRSTTVLRQNLIASRRLIFRLIARQDSGCWLPLWYYSDRSG